MRRWKKIVVAILAVVLLICVGLSIYLFRLGGLEVIVNDQIASMVKDNYNLDVRIGEVRGSLFTGLILEDVTVMYVDSTRQYRLADLRRISAGYSISNLWNRNYELEYLFVDSAVITLVRDSVDGWLLPVRLSARSETQGKPTPHFSVGAFGLNDVSVRILGFKDTLSFENIALSLALQSADETYSADVERLEFTSPDDRLRLNAAGGKLTYSQGSLLFKDIAIVAGDTRLRLDGSIRLGNGRAARVDFAIDNIDLARVTAFIGPRLRGVLDLNGSVTLSGDRLEGSVNIGGDFMFASLENLFVDFSLCDKRLRVDTLYGMILGTCAIDGNGEIDFSVKPESYRLTADIKNFNLRNLVRNSFDSDLNGFIDLKGESFRSSTLLLDVYTELHESSFHQYHFQEAVGDLRITTDSILFADSFRFAYYENNFYVTGGIDYDNQMNLKVQADLANLDRYRGKLFLDQPGGRGQAEVTISGRTSDPNLRGSFFSDSVWLYGLYCDSLWADVEIARFLTGKMGSVQVDCFDGNAWSLPFDTAHALLSVDSNLIWMDSVYVHNQFSSISCRGLLDHGAEPMRLSIDSLRLSVLDRSFFNEGMIHIEIDSTGFDFKKAAIGNDRARIGVSGRADFDESLDLLLSVEQVPVAPWMSLFEKEWGIDGHVSCEAAVRGTLGNPRFELSGAVDSLVYRELVLGDMSIGLRYQDKGLTIDSLLILSDPGRYYADGFLHVNLAFKADSADRFFDLPMDIHITATDRRFDLVSLVLPSVEQLDGDFSADFRLSGTPGDPQLEGGAYIKNGRLKYFDLEDPIHTDSAAIAMYNNLIVVDHIKAYTIDRKKGNKKRYAHIEGEIVVKSLENFYYDVDVSLPREFPFSYELEDIQGRIEGDLHVEGDSPPLVTGDLTLISMKYLVNFAAADEGSPIMSGMSLENSWDLDLNIDILSNYRIQNEDINAEFAGQINVVRQNGVYRFIGEMEILRGRGFMFDKTFRLEPGSRVIFEGEENLNARLDIIGRTRIAVTSQSTLEEEEAVPEQIDVGIHVTGTLEAPEIQPVEGSEFSREDIIPLIVANYYDSDSLSASGRLEQSITGVIGSQISQIGSKQLSHLGVETFEIDPYYQGRFDPFRARVTVGFYTAPNLYVYGRSALSLRSGQEVGFEYRFNKNFLLEGKGDEDQLYRLSLKLHWEF